MNKTGIAPQKVILILLGVTFGLFLLVPMATILVKSLSDGSGFMILSAAWIQEQMTAFPNRLV